jgi:hypothetical protein
VIALFVYEAHSEIKGHLCTVAMGVNKPLFLATDSSVENIYIENKEGGYIIF